MIALESAILRANPAYEAVPFNRLEPALREVMVALQAEPNGYGVLMPQSGSALPPVAVCRETALLFLTLRLPGPPPDYVLAAPGGEGTRVLRQLVLDRVLEIEGPQGFVGGPEACNLLGVSAAPGSGAIAELSQAALRYVAALRDDAPGLARRLYCYNRRPTTGRLRRRLPTREAVAQHLGLGDDGVNARRIDADWTPIGDGEAWVEFAARRPRRASNIVCKLYVGIDLEALPDRFGPIVDVLARSEASQFKVGADLDNLLRPDKLVAYFASKDALLAAGQTLTPVVTGQRVQAVPFTAEIVSNGALSWGCDPADVTGPAPVSWRQWVCERLAQALVTARNQTVDGVEPWHFALERLRLDGVDPRTFMPTAAWSEAAA